jgi:hypothetical protein
MPLVGLTSEASSTPSEFWTAFLRESINDVICGSAQTSVEPEGAPDVNVTVGTAVNESDVAVIMDGDDVAVTICVGINIAVAEGSGVGVGAVSVGAAAHAVTIELSRANPNRSVVKFFRFMGITSWRIISVITHVKKFHSQYNL